MRPTNEEKMKDWSTVTEGKNARTDVKIYWRNKTRCKGYWRESSLEKEKGKRERGKRCIEIKVLWLAGWCGVRQRGKTGMKMGWTGENRACASWPCMKTGATPHLCEGIAIPCRSFLCRYSYVFFNLALKILRSRGIHSRILIWASYLSVPVRVFLVSPWHQSQHLHSSTRQW